MCSCCVSLTVDVRLLDGRLGRRLRGGILHHVRIRGAVRGERLVARERGVLAADMADGAATARSSRKASGRDQRELVIGAGRSWFDPSDAPIDRIAIACALLAPAPAAPQARRLCELGDAVQRIRSTQGTGQVPGAPHAGGWSRCP
jgi:hypothetical protein